MVAAVGTANEVAFGPKVMPLMVSVVVPTKKLVNCKFPLLQPFPEPLGSVDIAAVVGNNGQGTTDANADAVIAKGSAIIKSRLNTSIFFIITGLSSFRGGPTNTWARKPKLIVLPPDSKMVLYESMTYRG